MTVNNLAVAARSPIVGRAVAPRRVSSPCARGGVLLVVLALAVTACATLAPGADPRVVRAEQLLKSADVGYGIAMEWYFRPGIAAGLNPTQRAALEALRTGFDPAYKGLQHALDAYKSGRAEGLDVKKSELRALFRAAQDAVSALAGPLLGVPMED